MCLYADRNRRFRESVLPHAEDLSVAKRILVEGPWGRGEVTEVREGNRKVQEDLGHVEWLKR